MDKTILTNGKLYLQYSMESDLLCLGLHRSYGTGED
jgi:hypothetical protein